MGVKSGFPSPYMQVILFKPEKAHIIPQCKILYDAFQHQKGAHAKYKVNNKASDDIFSCFQVFRSLRTAKL